MSPKKELIQQLEDTSGSVIGSSFYLNLQIVEK